MDKFPLFSKYSITDAFRITGLCENNEYLTSLQQLICKPSGNQHINLLSLQRIEKKMETLKKFCESHILKYNGVVNIMVDDKHKVLHCTIPKVASTVLRRKVLAMSSNSTLDRHHKAIDPHSYHQWPG